MCSRSRDEWTRKNMNDWEGQEGRGGHGQAFRLIRWPDRGRISNRKGKSRKECRVAPGAQVPGARCQAARAQARPGPRLPGRKPRNEEGTDRLPVDSPRRLIGVCPSVGCTMYSTCNLGGNVDVDRFNCGMQIADRGGDWVDQGPGCFLEPRWATKLLSQSLKSSTYQLIQRRRAARRKHVGGVNGSVPW